MDNIQMRLREFAVTTALPYLMSLSSLQPHIDRISLVLVGSAAAGLCRPDSDVDIAIICDDQTYADISEGTLWHLPRPSEISIAGTQLHYYGVPFERIDQRVSLLDDDYLYLYSNVEVLHDPSGRFHEWLSRLKSTLPDLRKQRLEGKLDMLIRRAGALESCVQSGDSLVIAQVYLEVITRVLKVIALLDDIPFNPRKRLMTTALLGPLGRRFTQDVGGLFSHFAALGGQTPISDNEFLRCLRPMLDMLCKEAEQRGFRVGLDSPDRRQAAC